MIRVICDVCGVEIAEYRRGKHLSEADGESRRGDPMQSWHKCAKCAEVLRMIDVSQLLKDAVIAMRADISTKTSEEKGADRQRTVRFVP